MKPHQTPSSALGGLALAMLGLVPAFNAAAAAPADEHQVPPDYVTLFPTWQRGFIVDDRLIHAAGDDGILLALFSSAMDQPVGRETRVMLPFTHLDSDARIPGRPGPSPANSIHPSTPPLLFCWDVDHGQLMLVFGRVKPVHDFYLRVYSLDSIGGPVREIPNLDGIESRDRHSSADVSFADHLQNIGMKQDYDRRTIPDFYLRPNQTLRFSIRLLPERRFQMLIQPLGTWVKTVVEASGGDIQAGSVEFLPPNDPEPFLHFSLAERLFLARQSGALEMVPQRYLKPGRREELRAEIRSWQRDVHGQFNIDEKERADGQVGDPLDGVGDFSKIPDWVASDPATHFMVQDRDRDMIRFFWGVSGYAELEVLDGIPEADGDPDDQVRVRFEELAAPPEMEHVRSLLLNPPEFERTKKYFLYDPSTSHFFSPLRGLPWRE